MSGNSVRRWPYFPVQQTDATGDLQVVADKAMVFNMFAWTRIFLVVSLRSPWCDRKSAPSSGHLTLAIVKG